MPLDLNTSIDFLKGRAEATLSVQTQIASTWVWPLKTLAQWEADCLQLDKSDTTTIAYEAIQASTKADTARGKLDGRMALLHDQTLAVVGVMRVRSQREPEHSSVVDELSARGDSRRAIEDEATALLSAWKEEFGGSAFIPAPGITYGAFEALLVGDTAASPEIFSLRKLKQALSDAVTVERSKVARLNVLLTRVERDVQDWYAEATSVFIEGTEIGDLVRTLPTTASYNPPTPATPAPVPPTPAA